MMALRSKEHTSIKQYATGQNNLQSFTCMTLRATLNLNRKETDIGSYEQTPLTCVHGHDFSNTQTGMVSRRITRMLPARYHCC